MLEACVPADRRGVAALLIHDLLEMLVPVANCHDIVEAIGQRRSGHDRYRHEQQREEEAHGWA